MHVTSQQYKQLTFRNTCMCVPSIMKLICRHYEVYPSGGHRMVMWYGLHTILDI